VLAAACVAAAAAALVGCGTGGTGTVTFNTLEVGDCYYDGDALTDPVALDLHFFGAERFADGMLIRIQQGTTAAINADGVYLSIGDVDQVTAGATLSVGLGENVESVLYLLNTCPAGRPAVGLTGTLVLDAFEDADGDGGPDPGDRIAGTLTASGLDDTNPDAVVEADLVLTFDFVMHRGHPSRRFPTYDALEVY
jgi:hypothetical protein